MRIAHLTDLHFGAEDPPVVAGLVDQLQQLAPDLVVVSGDFTQVGSIAEFAAAKTFLDQVPGRKFVVPGNHDVPARNMVERFLHPYRRFKRAFDSEVEPTVISEHVAIAGINSARRMRAGWNWALGSVSSAQLRRATAFLDASMSRFRILALHHPPFAVAGGESAKAVRHGGRLLDRSLCGHVDIILSGHSHRPLVSEMRPESGQRLLLVQSSTASSIRRRGSANGFTLLELRPDGEASVSPYAWDGERFDALWNQRYVADSTSSRLAA